MRNRTYLTLATALAGGLLAATPAFAQDDSRGEFEGLYIGASGGYDVQGSDDGSQIVFDRNLDGTFGDNVATAAGANAFSPGFCDGRYQGNAPGVGGSCENDRNRGSYYGRVGFDVQYGNIVVGAVGEFGKTEISDAVSAFSTTPAAYQFVRKINYEGSARLRAGYAFDRTLFYATGGAGYAEIENSFRTTNITNTFSERNRKNREFGYVVGGGIEQKIAKNISIGVEYSFHDYDANDYRVRATIGTSPATNPFVLAPNTTGTDFRRNDDHFRWSSLRATAQFRF